MAWIVKLLGRSPIGPMQEHMRVVVECAREIVPLLDSMASGDVSAVRDREIIMPVTIEVAEGDRGWKAGHLKIRIIEKRMRAGRIRLGLRRDDPPGERQHQGNRRTSRELEASVRIHGPSFPKEACIDD